MEPLRALSIRQPYAEMILRGMKTIEYRRHPTSFIGKTFYIYAPRTPGDPDEFVLSGCQPGDLPTGLLLGTARIARCRFRRSKGGPGDYEWHLIDVQRLKRPRKPKGQPQPLWFHPFGQPVTSSKTAAAEEEVLSSR